MFESAENPHGFRMDVGSSVHIMIHQTGIIEELELEKYGLEYIDMDPIMSYPVPTVKGVIHFWKIWKEPSNPSLVWLPKMLKTIRILLNSGQKINKGVLASFMTPPKGGKIVSEIVKAQIRDGSMFNKGEHMNGLQRILSSYGKVVDDAFESPYLKAALVWFAAQSGPLPDQSATGDFVGWQSMLHESGAKHPKGGSGMLTQAMKNLIQAHGGTILTNTPVEKILVRSGRAIGVQTEEGQEFLAPIVVSNAHVQTTMLKMVGPDHLASSMVKKVENINVGNGFGMVIRCAVEELPVYTAAPEDPLYP
jgi:phytoene dehydrogenase-like protein